jgi:hypothetical protein
LQLLRAGGLSAGRYATTASEPIAPHRTGPGAPGKAAKARCGSEGSLRFKSYFATDEFRARIRSDNEKYGKVIRSIGTKLD